MNKKVCKILIIVALAVGVSCLVCYGALVCYQLLIVSATPDSSDWILTNGDYTVCPVIDDDSVTFYVKNKEGKVVFEPEEGWRDWDFKSINIDEENNIVAISGDTGASVYVQDEKDCFVKLGYEMYDFENGEVSIKQSVSEK